MIIECGLFRLCTIMILLADGRNNINEIAAENKVTMDKFKRIDVL